MPNEEDWKKLDLPKLVTKSFQTAFALLEISRNIEEEAHRHITENFPFLKGKQFKLSNDCAVMYYREPKRLVQGDACYASE